MGLMARGYQAFTIYYDIIEGYSLHVLFTVASSCKNTIVRFFAIS